MAEFVAASKADDGSNLLLLLVGEWMVLAQVLIDRIRWLDHGCRWVRLLLVKHELSCGVCVDVIVHVVGYV